jgi:nucleotide-binding universal stress UspA family protein
MGGAIMQRILAVLNRPETAHSVLVAAGRLNRILGGCQLDLLHPRPDIDPMFMPTEEVWTDEQQKAFTAKRNALVGTLQQAVADWQSHDRDAPRICLRVEDGEIAATLRAAAHGCDLAILGADGADPEARLAIQTTLMDAKVSTMLVPAQAPADLGHRVAIAWDSSQAAETSVQGAMAVLQHAQEVVVLIANEGHPAADLPEDLLQILQTHRVACRTERFDLNDRDIGSALLDEAHAARADLLVMGAYTHHRFMEALFGGATRHVLSDVSLPVWMHH